jgi:hypothetical protein
MLDQIIFYLDMCKAEGSQQIQKGMNFGINPQYSVILMSLRSNAPYKDKILNDGITIEYEGHDEPKNISTRNPKEVDQPRYNTSGKPTENGKFIDAVISYKKGNPPRLVKVYEKIIQGVWSLKGFFNLVDYRVENDGKREVFIFTLTLSSTLIGADISSTRPLDLTQTRLIPSEIKKKVWERDRGKCVLCGSTSNIHFDHELPYSKGGSSITERNIRILCADCNLKKSNKIE